MDGHAEGPIAPLRILVADDEPPLRSALTRILRSAGHEVVAVEDGSRALAEFNAATFDLVLSDVVMPKLDGVGLLRAIREHSEDVPFILFAGAPSAESAIHALRYHATEYLPKPISPEQLLDAVAHAARFRQLARIRREALAHYQRLPPTAVSPLDLAPALERGIEALFMVYQPIVDWSGRTVFGYEALVRSSETSLPHPGALFDAAEALGRLTDLGRAIRRICGSPLSTAAPETALFVNLHTQDLLDESLYDPSASLATIASRVVLEITERAHLEKVDDVRGRIARLRDLGFRIAIDDIGAGYSGLNSFAVVRPDVVKLDLTLIRGVDADPIKQKLVRAMRQLCADVGIMVVAEGVETVAERDTLIDLGCNYFQGYLFARPGKPFPAPSL